MRDLALLVYIIAMGLFLWNRFPGIKRWMYEDTPILDQWKASLLALIALCVCFLFAIALFLGAFYAFHVFVPAFVVIKLVG